MDCSRNFVITSHAVFDKKSLLVWQGRFGWLLISDPSQVNKGHVYKTEKIVSTAIDRMRAKRPHDQRWSWAKYCTLDEATAPDNPRESRLCWERG